MISVEAILFDLDGTLIDSKRDIAESVHFIQRKHGRAASPEADIASFIGNGVPALLQRALGPKAEQTLEADVTLFKKHYREHCLDHTYVYPGVRETLHHFRYKKMAVVTNKPVRISRFMLERLGLAGYFRGILGGDSTSRKKPHPDPIFQTLDRLGTRSLRDVIIVGDGYQDIQAGKSAGIRTCGLISNIGDSRRLHQSAPDFTILKMEELMRIIN
jgi:phosphoglycolate phosphatase